MWHQSLRLCRGQSWNIRQSLRRDECRYPFRSGLARSSCAEWAALLTNIIRVQGDNWWVPWVPDSNRWSPPSSQPQGRRCRPPQCLFPTFREWRAGAWWILWQAFQPFFGAPISLQRQSVPSNQQCRAQQKSVLQAAFAAVPCSRQYDRRWSLYWWLTRHNSRERE